MTMASKIAISLLLKEECLKYISGEKPPDPQFPLHLILAPPPHFHIVPRSLNNLSKVVIQKNGKGEDHQFTFAEFLMMHYPDFIHVLHFFRYAAAHEMPMS